jgi:hypothetical protein
MYISLQNIHLVMNNHNVLIVLIYDDVDLSIALARLPVADVVHADFLNPATGSVADVVDVGFLFAAITRLHFISADKPVAATKSFVRQS